MLRLIGLILTLPLLLVGCESSDMLSQQRGNETMEVAGITQPGMLHSVAMYESNGGD